MFKNLSIRTKLTLILLLVGILSINITGWLCYLNPKNTVEKVYTNNLASIRETKKQQIETYFNQIRDQVITFSEDQMIIDAMKQFKRAFYSVKKNNVCANNQILHYALSVSDYYKNEYLARLNPNVINKREVEQYLPDNDAAIILQYHYIANNRNPTGFKDNLEMAADGSQYSRIHSKYHPIIRNYLKKFGYYDIFLIDADTGRIVYSVFKEVDYATSLLTGPYRNTNFARVFKEAQNAPDNEFARLVDFEFYDPSYSDPASFIASPIFDGDKQIGVLVFQMPVDEINQVMTGNYNWGNEGLGESGETYIAGSDYKMRNDSRFLIEEPDRYFELIEQAGADKEVINQIKSHSTSIMFQNLYTEAVEDALNGNTNTRIIIDYRGVPVLSSYTPLNIEGVNWVILSEIDKEEAFASLDVIRDRIVFITLIFSALVAIIALLISKNISRPIIKLVNSMDSVSKGDLSKRVNIARKDEIGKLVDTFNKMADNLVEANINKEQALMESMRAREYSENLIETAQDAIICINEHGIVNVWNKAAEKIFGYSEREISGEPITTIIPERYKMQHEEGLRRFLHTSEARIIGKTVEVSGIAKEGIEVPIEMSLAFQLNEKGDYSFTAIIRDITERKEAEERLLLAKEAAEVANQVKSEFLATMSHEIRTPMNGVVGMTELILDTELTPEQREYAEAVRSSANSLLTIINDILDFSKIEAGKLETEHIDFDLRVTVDDIIDIFSARTDEEGLEFSCFIDPEVPS
ncbi:MAG: PAS domain S-box protein, partial [Thermodesulfobacteriota bacterium]